jgi:nucleoid DNA-binding protein
VKSYSREFKTKSAAGRMWMAALVQQHLNLKTKKEADRIINTVISALEEVLREGLTEDGFELKLNSFGKFIIRHKPGIYRKIGYSGEMVTTRAKRKVKFVALGDLRQREKVQLSPPIRPSK